MPFAVIGEHGNSQSYGKQRTVIVLSASEFFFLCVCHVGSSIRFQGTTDAVAAQFFLKNIHTQMSSAGSALFGKTQLLHSRPNTFGELMRVIISPSKSVEEAVNWVLNGGPDPHLALHMRMLMNRYF